MTKLMFGNLETWARFITAMRWTRKVPKPADSISERADIPIATVYRMMKEARRLRLVEPRGETTRTYETKKNWIRKVKLWSLTTKGQFLARGMIEAGLLDILEGKENASN